MPVALASFASGKYLKSHIIPGHIRDDLVGGSLEYHCAFGHLKDYILSVFAVTALGASLFSGLGGIFPLVSVVLKCIKSFVHFKDHRTALASVTSVGTAGSYIFFTAEADMAVAAFS